MEDIDSKLDLVLEGHRALDVKIDKNHEEFREFRKEANYKFGVLTEMTAKNTEDIEIMKVDLHKNTEDIEIMKVDLHKNTKDIEIMKVDLHKNTEDIGMMKMDLHVIKDDLKEKVSREEFKIIEKRIDLLERKFQKA